MLRMGTVREDASASISDGLDHTKFKDSVDVDKAVDIVQMFLEGYFTRKQEKLKSMGQEVSIDQIDDLFEDCDAYLQELKSVFYK